MAAVDPKKLARELKEMLKEAEALLKEATQRVKDFDSAKSKQGIKFLEDFNEDD